MSETSGAVVGAGVENDLQFNVSETSGPVAGTRVENELPDHETGIVNDFLEDVASRGQVRRHAHPVGIGHAPLFQKIKEDKKVLSGDFFGMMFLETWKVVVLLAFIFESDVDVSGSLVPDGAFAVLVDFDVGSSGSCTAASNEAAIVPSGCSSSTGCGRREEKEKDVKTDALLCQPWERVHDCCSLFSRCRVVGCSAPGY